MNIILIGPIPPYRGGISHYNQMLFSNLRTNHEVEIISWRLRYPSFLYPGKNQLDPKGEKIVKNDPRFKLNFLNPLSWINVGKYVKKSKADLIILHWVSPILAPIFWCTLKFKGQKKTLMICHNVKPHEKNPFDNFLAKKIFEKVDYFIVHSKQDAKNLKKIKPNAIYRKGFLPNFSLKLSKIVNKVKVKKTEINTIMFFGFVREYKGLKILLKAMPFILKKKKCKLSIVGEFWDDKKEYISIIDKLNIGQHVEIIDKYVPDNDVEKYFALSDVVVLPYLSATQSAIVQLAYSYDKPVISTNIGGLSEVIENKKTGYLVNPGDKIALAKAVIDYFTKKKEMEFRKNIQSFKKKFSWEKYIKIIEDFD